MGLFKMRIMFLLLLSLSFCLGATESPSTTPGSHILYLMHTGNTEQALRAYEALRQETGSHDFELVERIGLVLLDQGFRIKDPETQLLTLFGAGISGNEKALYIVEDGLASNQQELELISLNFLARYHNDRADQILHRAMKSNSLLIRLEAAFQLADKKDPKAVGQIEGLMSKLPEQVWAIFPQLFAISGTPEAKKILRKLLTNSNEQIRVASIISVAQYGHDDFLPIIERLASHHEVIQQEACAAALGALRDEGAISKLQQLARSPNITVQLAALQSLYALGREEVRGEVEKIAKTRDLFAISLLGNMPGSEPVLVELIKYPDLQVRVNAAAALLELQDSRCLVPLCPILIRDSRDFAVVKVNSHGKSLSAFKVVPSAKENFAQEPIVLEMSLHLREALLMKAVELPEKDFLSIAHKIFETQQNDLVPVLIEILENHPTPAVIALLKKYQEKVGAPLIRNYCNLALYRLKEPGPYADNLRDWVTQQCNVDLIQFRPVVPWDMRVSTGSSFELTPQETSRLLVDSFESFVSVQDDKGIDMLISVIQKGNSKNKYALIGLLMRAIQ